MWHPLDNISEELIDTIASFCCRRTLPNLCRVSKQLNRIATPHLYANVSLRSDIGGDGDLRHLLPLAHKLFLSPALAALVKSFALPDGWAGCNEAERLAGFEVKPWPDLGTPETEQLLRQMCYDYVQDGEGPERLYKKMYAADAEVVITVLVANLPNVHKLDLNFGDSRGHEFFCSMVKSSGRRLRAMEAASLGPPGHTWSLTAPLTKPMDVLITESDDGDIKYLESFFHLPYLRSLYAFKFGDGVYSGMAESPFALLRPRSCSVQYIELRGSTLAEDTLQYLMKATIPEKLKTFLYEMGGPLTLRSAHLPHLMQCLEDHQDHLETLALSYEELGGQTTFERAGWDADADMQPVVSFTLFRSLRRLRIAPEMIWGHTHNDINSRDVVEALKTRDMFWKALPESLEEFWLTRSKRQWVPGLPDDGIDFVPHILIPALYRLVEQSSEQCPHLRSIRIELLPYDWETEWLDLLAEFCQAADARGIHCTILFLHKYHKLGPFYKFTQTYQVERGWGWNEDVDWSEIPCNANKIWRKHVIHTANEHDLKGKIRALKADVFTYTDPIRRHLAKSTQTPRGDKLTKGLS
ncbi:hypothetical protein BKA58DRAFT_138597 [Alternaria rosae]|uniref:uncharacterized protein n=1 Tax=Alternaria rosae TaxID=1187941 RepID=UPI001E8EBEA1|nr:uncharacterized protein BKA58DRAFT_138597 [Alternaria rosae]KAH6876292.1 hypothetical protein BKA58DRAFT_138597 [Alternaria rosae]